MEITKFKVILVNFGVVYLGVVLQLMHYVDDLEWNIKYTKEVMLKIPDTEYVFNIKIFSLDETLKILTLSLEKECQ